MLWYFGGGRWYFGLAWTMNIHQPEWKAPSFHPYKAHLWNFLGMCYTISTETMYGLRGLHQFWIMPATLNCRVAPKQHPTACSQALDEQPRCRNLFGQIFVGSSPETQRTSLDELDYPFAKIHHHLFSNQNKSRIDRIAGYASPEGPTSVHWFGFCWMFFLKWKMVEAAILKHKDSESLYAGGKLQK